jgi:hypothetical protein
MKQEHGEVQDWYNENKQEIFSFLVIDTSDKWQGHNILYKKYITWCTDNNKMYIDKAAWFVKLSRLILGSERK